MLLCEHCYKLDACKWWRKSNDRLILQIKKTAFQRLVYWCCRANDTYVSLTIGKPKFVLLPCALPILATKQGSRILEKKESETQKSKTAFGHLQNYSTSAQWISNNYSISTRWIWDGKQPTRPVGPSWLFTISYPTSTNGIIVLLKTPSKYRKID